MPESIPHIIATLQAVEQQGETLAQLASIDAVVVVAKAIMDASVELGMLPGELVGVICVEWMDMQDAE